MRLRLQDGLDFGRLDDGKFVVHGISHAPSKRTANPPGAGHPASCRNFINALNVILPKTKNDVGKVLVSLTHLLALLWVREAPGKCKHG